MKFTVKVRLPNGDESIHGCDTIDVIGGPNAIRPAESLPCGAAGSAVPARDMYSEGIFLDRTEQLSAPGEPPIYGASHIIQFGGDETDDRKARKGGKVWVMNGQGATVTTYDL